MIEPVVDRPRPLMNRRILGASTAWADVRYFTIKSRVIPPDPVGQGVFFRLDLAGSNNIALACRQMLGRWQAILGRLPMTDRSLHRSIAGGFLGLDLRLRKTHNGY